jgi:hypothetical protein
METVGFDAYPEPTAVTVGLLKIGDPEERVTLACAPVPPPPVKLTVVPAEYPAPPSATTMPETVDVGMNVTVGADV